MARFIHEGACPSRAELEGHYIRVLSGYCQDLWLQLLSRFNNGEADSTSRSSSFTTDNDNSYTNSGGGKLQATSRAPRSRLDMIYLCLHAVAMICKVFGALGFLNRFLMHRWITSYMPALVKPAVSCFSLQRDSSMHAWHEGKGWRSSHCQEPADLTRKTLASRQSKWIKDRTILGHNLIHLKNLSEQV